MARKKITIVTIEIAGEFVEAKECTKCGEVRTLSEYSSNGKGGKRGECKLCDNNKSKNRYKENKEKILDREKRYYEENKKKILDRKKKYYKENKEKSAEQRKKYYEENRESILKQKDEYRKKNKEEISKRQRIHRQKNKEEVLKREREYRRENKGIYTAHKQRRRARKKGLPDTLTATQSTNMFEKGCALTGETFDIHLDHFIPLSWGHGGTIIENMIPLRGDLNLSKNNANPFEWIRREDIRQQIDMKRWYETVEYLSNLNGMSAQEFEEYVYWCEENKRDLTAIA